MCSWCTDYYMDFLKRYLSEKNFNTIISLYEEDDFNSLSVTGGKLCSTVQDKSVEITFKAFNKHEYTQIKNILFDIIESHDILSNDVFISRLKKTKIDIFSNISFKCSCHKRRLCRHSLLLLYHFAYLLKDNPYLLFNVKGIDLKDLEDNIKGLQNIQDIRNILNSSQLIDTDTHLNANPMIPDLYAKNYSFIENSNLANYYKCILELLNKSIGEKFNVDDIIDAKYKRRTTNFSRPNRFIDRWISYNVKDLSININNNYSISRISTYGGHNLNKYKSPTVLFIYLYDLVNSDFSSYNALTSFIVELYDLSLKLISNNAIVPELFKCNDKIAARWVPCTSNTTINNIINDISTRTPHDLITFNRENISAKSMTITFISLIIQGMLNIITENKNIPEQLALIMTGKKVNLRAIEDIDEILIVDKELLLLNEDINYKLYLVISEYNESFMLELFVKIGENTVNIHEVLKEDVDYKDRLLHDVEVASNYYPKLEAVLNKKSIALGGDDFLSFFNDALPLIENMGVGIILPKSLKNILKPRIKLQKSANSSTGKLSINNIAEYDWMIAIGDSYISKDEFEDILSKNKRLVRISHNYYNVDLDYVKHLIKVLKSLPSDMNTIDLVKLSYEGEIDNIAIEVDNKILNQLLSIERKNTPLPLKLNATLRDYQVIGYQWILQNFNNNFGCILADDMGLGKTIQTLSVIQHFKENGKLDDFKVLVIVPTSLLFNWQHEIDRFTPELKTRIYHGPDRSLKGDDYDILLTSYGMIRSDKNKFTRRKWLLVVVDEAQNIKNPDTKQSKAIKSVKSKYRLALTGTPIENRLSEYWSIFDFVNKDYLGSLKEFTKKFIIPIEEDHDEKKLEQLKKLTQTFILRRLKTQKEIIKDLPEKSVNDIYCKLSLNQAALYEAVLNTKLEQIKEDESIYRRGHILELITALKQICNHPAQYTRSKKVKASDSGKLTVLLEILRTILENDEKTLIFTQYVKTGHILKQLIEENLRADVLFLHGSLSKKKREDYIRLFQEDNNIKIFILSLKAGGVGLNLTAACNVIHYDLWWNPAVENQATDRAYRIGQNKNVMVYRFITENTLEEHINDILSTKKELTDMAMQDTGKFITQMNDDQLNELLRLR